MSITPMRSTLPLLVLLLATGLTACTRRSDVAELEPGVYALSVNAPSQARAARAGVDRARSWCVAHGRGFEPVRTIIGRSDYSIAFRCPAPLPELDMPEPAATSPVNEDLPGFRREPGLL
jgi:hypothetical protein